MKGSSKFQQYIFMYLYVCRIMFKILQSRNTTLIRFCLLDFAQSDAFQWSFSILNLLRIIDMKLRFNCYPMPHFLRHPYILCRFINKQYTPISCSRLSGYSLKFDQFFAYLNLIVQQSQFLVAGCKCKFSKVTIFQKKPKSILLMSNPKV